MSVSFSPVPTNLMGFPVTSFTESAAPPLVSPSIFVIMTPVSSTSSLKAFAAFTASWGNAGLCLLAGAVTCYLPYLFYTYGLSGLETGRASILASVEPVVATIIGILVYHETMSLLAALGVALVLSAVVLLNLKTKEPA